MKHNRTVLVILLVSLLMGCGPADPTDSQNGDEAHADNAVKIFSGALNDVYRVEDAEAGVICWVYNGHDKGGIDCLPIEQTRLEK